MLEVKQHTRHHGNVKASTVNAYEGDTELFMIALLHRNKNDPGLLDALYCKLPISFIAVLLYF